MNSLAVIVPTRSRPHNVPGIVEAWNQTSGFDAADLVFVVDADDPLIDEYMREFGRDMRIQRVVARHWQPMVPKLNRMAVQAAKEYAAVAFMGDDHLPRTQQWAQRIMANHLTCPRPAIFQTDDEPAYTRGAGIVYGRDGFQNRALPTWWSMDSRIIRALGKMVPAPVQHLFCDNAIKLLGKRTEQLMYDDGILIEHMHPVAGKGSMDAQYARVNRMQQYALDEAAFRAWTEDGIERDATLLADIWG